MEFKPLAQPGMAFVNRSQRLQPLGLASFPYRNAPSLRLWLLARALFSRGAAFMHCSKYIIGPIAVLTLIAEMCFGQGNTITSLNTKDTPGTTTTVTVAGATASPLTGKTFISITWAASERFPATLQLRARFNRFRFRVLYFCDAIPSCRRRPIMFSGI
jgi:hypothetical protein